MDVRKGSTIEVAFAVMLRPALDMSSVGSGEWKKDSTGLRGLPIQASLHPFHLAALDWP